MNDIILSGLLNLFAVFGSKYSLDREESRHLISSYLGRHFGVRNPQHYLSLYSDLRDFYDDSPEMDKDLLVEGVCTKVQAKIRTDEQAMMLLRLMEFCNHSSSHFNPEDSIFRKVAELFSVPDDMYADFAAFVQARKGGNILVSALGDGTLKTLYIKHFNKLIFTYDGPSEVLMNDVQVLSGVSQTWQESGVLKGSFFQPMYYSTIMARYENWHLEDSIEFCGRDIEFRFKPGEPNGIHNFSFTLHSGQLVAIMGGSGTGKSTLLSLLNGTNTPQSGSITINGHDISEPAAKAHIGFVPQDDLLVEELTVYQNLYFTARLCFEGMPHDELDRKVMTVLTQLGLDAARDLKVGSPLQKYISGGQRKRLNIALELIREPGILFLDEPTSGLSSSDTEKVMLILKEQTYKGRLVVVNIHQPSSDVYKLFDRLWLLDKGGYPVFDGNPIEAVPYFKTAAGYADAESSTCPTCGNVNPEVVLNIIDEKSLSDSGQLTDKRKVAPEEWHNLYVESRPEMQQPEVSAVPPSDQKRPGKLRQFAIFLKRNVTTKVTNLQYMLITLLEAPLLAAVCAVLTRYVPAGGSYTVLDNKNLVSYFFMAIIVAVFLGMSGSAEEIIKDRALLKREKFLNLSYRSYIWSKIIYMAGVCLVQTFLFILVGNLIMGVRGLLFIWWFILFLSAFLSALIGLLLSQCMNSVVAIYITIPILLIPQILLCGLVVKFEDLNPNSETGNVPVVGDFIPSRWAFEALAVSSFSNFGYERDLFEMDREHNANQYYKQYFLTELESQAETREAETIRDGEEKPHHLNILKNEIPYLCRACNLAPYEGDYSYGSIVTWVDATRKILADRVNKVTMEEDALIRARMKEIGKDGLLQLKRNNYNLQLEMLVSGTDFADPYVVVGDHIVPRWMKVYLEPRSHNGRAPFYSSVKVLGGIRIPTFWFDNGVLILMCLLLSVCLFADFPGRFVRKERN